MFLLKEETTLKTLPYPANLSKRCCVKELVGRGKSAGQFRHLPIASSRPAAVLSYAALSFDKLQTGIVPS